MNFLKYEKITSWSKIFLWYIWWYLPTYYLLRVRSSDLGLIGPSLRRTSLHLHPWQPDRWLYLLCHREPLYKVWAAPVLGPRHSSYILPFIMSAAWRVVAGTNFYIFGMTQIVWAYSVVLIRKTLWAITPNYPESSLT